MYNLSRSGLENITFEKGCLHGYQKNAASLVV